MFFYDKINLPTYLPTYSKLEIMSSESIHCHNQTCLISMDTQKSSPIF